MSIANYSAALLATCCVALGTHSAWARPKIDGFAVDQTIPYVSHMDSSYPPGEYTPPPGIVSPRDVAYPGTIRLVVDTTNVRRRIVDVHETIPVPPGELTLLYPKWIPGNHSPTGPISKVAGLFITANGRRVEWNRDRVDVYAFHISVPADVRALDVEFQYLTPLRRTEGRISFSSKLIDLAWNTVVLYPAGYYTRRIEVAPAIKLPSGWHYASALDVETSQGNLVRFKNVSMDELVDSPVYAGAYFKRLNLSTDFNNPVFLDLFAESIKNLSITRERLQWHKQMVEQTQELFGSTRHYRHYDFLLLLSNAMGGIGLEHQQSSEGGSPENYFSNWPEGCEARDLLAHEYTHSWNGKFRLPADLWTPNFNVPMQDDLLWVYEGLTQYVGYVLTARSGLRSVSETRDLIARNAANVEVSKGRTWRPLIDTTNEPIISQRSLGSWVSWERPEDYYLEGMLIWLDVDTRIRDLSGDTRSLDDFMKLFFGIDDGSHTPRTYRLNDVEEALTKVQPYDWSGFLNKLIYHESDHAPEEGITRGGYRLRFSDQPGSCASAGEQLESGVSFATSLGLSVRSDGFIEGVWWESPAFKAGVTPDMQIVAVDGNAFKVEILRKAISKAEHSKSPIKLRVRRDDEIQTLAIEYHDGLRYPLLERIPGSVDRLNAILTPTRSNN